MAAPLSIPLVNLLVPVLGVATFTHLFHRLQARAPITAARKSKSRTVIQPDRMIAADHRPDQRWRSAW